MQLRFWRNYFWHVALRATDRVILRFYRPDKKKTFTRARTPKVVSRIHSRVKKISVSFVIRRNANSFSPSFSFFLPIDVFISTKLSRREYTWQRFDPNSIPDHQLFPHLIQLLFPPPSSPPRSLGSTLPSLLCCAHIAVHEPAFYGPPWSKTPGKIIQISTLRFPSNPGERGSTRVDAQHGGASGARVPTDVSQSEPDYKPAITVRPRSSRTKCGKTWRKSPRKRSESKGKSDEDITLMNRRYEE